VPLVKSASNQARSKNIATEIRAGKPRAQAAAIGYSEQRAARKKATDRWAEGKRKTAP
jgi:hypothetical protein